MLSSSSVKTWPVSRLHCSTQVQLIAPSQPAEKFSCGRASRRGPPHAGTAWQAQVVFRGCEFPTYTNWKDKPWQTITHFSILKDDENVSTKRRTILMVFWPGAASWSLSWWTRRTAAPLGVDQVVTSHLFKWSTLKIMKTRFGDGQQTGFCWHWVSLWWESSRRRILGQVCPPPSSAST